MYLLCAFSFQFSPNLITLIFQVSDNASYSKITTKMNSISFGLSYAQIKMNVSFFIVTQKFVSRHLSIAAVSNIHFLHRRFQLSIPDWSSLKPIKGKNVNCVANAFDMLTASCLYDKLDNTLLDDSFVLSEDNLPVVSALEN